MVYHNEKVVDSPDEVVTETEYVMEEESQLSSPGNYPVKSSITKPKEVCIQLPVFRIFFLNSMLSYFLTHRNVVAVFKRCLTLCYIIENILQVFQMMAAVVDPDLLELIPGDADLFFRKLELCLGINYTNAGQMCLLQGRYVEKMHLMRTLPENHPQLSFLVF